MSLPPSSFAAAFRSTVIPKLTRETELHGLYVGLGLETVRAGYAAVMLVALDHDAGHLPPEHFAALEDWVMDALLARACVKREEFETHERAMEHVHLDIERWNKAVIAHGETREVAHAG